MQIGKRYIFVGANGDTFTGSIVRITDKSITFKHKSDKNYQNSLGQYGEGTYHIPHDLIVKTFPIDELIPGKRYIFKFTDKEFQHVFVSISGNYESVHCYEISQGRTVFPLYWIKDIQIVN
jgi:hypothetical protein